VGGRLAGPWLSNFPKKKNYKVRKEKYLKNKKI
jgi:hypothetical protein